MNNNATKHKSLNTVIDTIVYLHNNRHKNEIISDDNREHFKSIIKPLITELDYSDDGYLKVQTIYWLMEMLERYVTETPRLYKHIVIFDLMEYE